MYCHDLEVMSLNPGRVELGVCSTSVVLKPKNPMHACLSLPRITAVIFVFPVVDYLLIEMKLGK